MPTRTRLPSRLPSRRLNPEDWFGYSVADDIKVIVVNTPITVVRDTSSQQKTAMKPYGLWYACGGEWIEWMKSEVPDWLEDGQYLYEVFPKYSTTGLYDYERGEYAGGVLRLSTKEEVEIFHDLFGAWNEAEWVEVAKIWDGIEICPYQYELRLSSVGWYYTWDVASGCVWRPSGLASPLGLLKSRESASAAPRRGVDRGNPRRRPVRRNGLLGGLALAGAAFAGGVYAEKTSGLYDRVKAMRAPKAPVSLRPADSTWTTEPEAGGKGTLYTRVFSGDTYQIFARRGGPFILDVFPLGSDRPARIGEYPTLGQAKTAVLAKPPNKNFPKSNPAIRLARRASKEEFEAAKNRFYDALEAEAGEGQTYYFGPFVVIGDQKGGVLGKLELDVWQGMPDGGLAVSLSYIGVNKDARQRGQGTRLLQIVLAAADAAGLPVTLTVSPQKEYGDKKPPMNKKELRAFYEKYGFVPVKGVVDRMVRPVSPRTNPRRR